MRSLYLLPVIALMGATMATAAVAPAAHATSKAPVTHSKAIKATTAKPAPKKSAPQPCTTAAVAGHCGGRPHTGAALRIGEASENGVETRDDPNSLR